MCVNALLPHDYTVNSRYIVVGGFQAMVPRYKWEHDISGNCHEPKSGSISQRVVSDNGAFVDLAANSAHRQWIWWHPSKFNVALQNHMVELLNLSRLCMNNQLEANGFAEIVVLPAILFSPKIKVANQKTAIYSTVRVHFQKFRWKSNDFCIRSVSTESLESNVAVISWFCGRILKSLASWVQPYFGVHKPLEEYLPSTHSWFAAELSQCLVKLTDVNSMVKQRRFD